MTFEVGDVVVHQDGGPPETVTDVEMKFDVWGWTVEYVTTTRRHAPARQFTRTTLRVIP